MKRFVSMPKRMFFAVIIALVFITSVFVVSVVLANTLFADRHMRHSASLHASAAMDESRIRYISVPIVSSDTLSGIAKEYYSEEFGSIESYMSRIKEYNSLTSDNIYAGNHLIVPVYQDSDVL